MVALFIAGTAGVGKTAISAGLARHWQANGSKAGFLDARGADEADAAFMKQLLSLEESLAALCPETGDASKVKGALAAVARGRDVVMVEGRLGQNPDDSLSQACYQMAAALGAKVIIVAGYGQPAAAGGKGFGQNLSGVIVNKVPASQLKRVQAEAAADLGQAGIRLLGVLPEDRALAALTVGELAECIQGKILNNAEKATDLVENLMLGAMVVDSGLSYFGRKRNKAAIVRSDRPDMQLAALETSTRCLVLSGGREEPIYGVRQKAESKGIPVVLAAGSTDAIVTSIEQALGKNRFRQEQKLGRLAEMMQCLNPGAILQ